jgi:hypothetical protein
VRGQLGDHSGDRTDERCVADLRGHALAARFRLPDRGARGLDISVGYLQRRAACLLRGVEGVFRLSNS